MKVKDLPRPLYSYTTAMLLCFVSLTGCSGQKHKYTGGSTVSRAPFYETERGTQGVPRYHLPWEVWALHQTLVGSEIKNRAFIQAEQYTERGDRKSALSHYLQVQPSILSRDEIDTLALRIASMQLAVDQPKEALGTLSKYFLTTGRSESDVDARFSLVFAYAYGRTGDFDQSCAWFSRVARVSTRSVLPPSTTHVQGDLRNSAEQGMRMLLRIVPDPELTQLTHKWFTDAFIHGLIGQEQRRRAHQGYAVAVSRTKPFWELDGTGLAPESSSHTAVLPSNSQGRQEIGVLLPLSGQYAGLGSSIKNGIELALNLGAAAHSNPITPIFRDDGGDTTQALSVARELFSSDSTALILGPLLTASASQVGHLAREVHRPVITFSKGSEFQPGEGVFRLGPTVSSQVESLLDAVHTHLHVTRFAVVYPDDPGGQEFAHAFSATVQTYGGQVLVQRSFAKGDFGSFISIAAEIERLDVEAVFFPDSIQSASRFFASFSPLEREHIRPLGIANWDSAGELQQSRTVLDGAVFVSPFFNERASAQSAQFVSNYQERYREKPDFLAAQGFDAATVALEALKRQRDTGGSLSAALQSIDLYDGLTGTIRVRADGELERRFVVVTLKEGTVTEIQ